MKYVKNNVNENNVLTIYLEGEINSLTSEEVENEILSTLNNESFDKLVLNLGEVTYVSSSGLRVVLRLKQTYKDFAVEDTCPSVYEVFQMTGFTNIMPVSKALVSVDVTGCEVIGEGYFSIVYRLDKDTIVKAYRKQTDIKEVERELGMAKKAFILGIPTAISYDIVKIKDKLGVRFEMLDSISLRDMFRDNPDHFDELLDKYVELMKKINTTEADTTELPNTKERWLLKLNEISEMLTDSEYTSLLTMINNIPDRKTFVHGDCHFKNIMSQNGELLLIDMDTLSIGHPIFELAAGLFIPYIAFEEDDPGNCERFLGVSKELAFKIANTALEKYLNTDKEEYKDKIRIVGYTHLLWWCKQNEPDNKVRINGVLSRLKELVKKYKDLDIGI